MSILGLPKSEERIIMSESVLLDTSFFIRLLNENDLFHQSALNYYKYFMENGMIMKMSTIAVAEFCVKGCLADLPVKNLLFVPFNMNHAIRAGQLLKVIFDERKRRGAVVQPRTVVPNDTKMFAQADTTDDIKYFCSADSEAVKVYELMKSDTTVKFRFIDIRNHPYTETFGILDL